MLGRAWDMAPQLVFRGFRILLFSISVLAVLVLLLS